MILATKLHPPSLKPNTLRRERLLKFIKNSLERKLVLISGDAGYGKTTLLVEVKEESHLPCVFYDLDPGDSDFVVFFSYLLYGLDRLEPNLVRRSRGLLRHGESLPRSYELAMGTLINELVEKRKEELFFVLDDYHVLSEDSLVHKALDYFIDHLPDTVHVVIASRTVPPLPSLAKWRAKQDMMELTREELRFTEEEVGALLAQVYQTVLPDEELKRVSEQTEGWITGIQLILQSLGKDGKTLKETLKGYLEANQPLFEYFASEVLSSEAPGVQDFLRKSAILDVLTPEDCEGVLAVKGSKNLLRDLERRNLFLSSVGKGQYKYHRLFREFLLGGFRDAAAKMSLHLRAAAYYKRKRQPEQVLEHYLEAGSYGEAGRVIAKVADKVVAQARFAALKNWLGRIPEEVRVRQPQLLVIQGRLCIEEGHLEEAEALCVRAESALSKNGLKRDGDRVAFTDALYQHGGLLWQKGAYPEALKVLGKALSACPARDDKKRGDILNLIGISWLELGDYRKARFNLLRAKAAVERFKNYYWGTVIEHNLVSLLREQGELGLVFDLEKSLIEQIRENYFLEVGIIFASAAINALDVGQAAWAEWCLSQGQALCRPYQDPISQAAFHRGLAALHMEKAEWNQAGQHLGKAKEECERFQLAIPTFYVHLDLIRFSRYQGDRENGEKWLAQAQEKFGGGGDSQKAQLLAERGLVEASWGEYDRAGQTVRDCLTLSRKHQRRREEFLAQIACTWIHVGRGREKEAVRALRRALRLAKAKGYDGILERELRGSTVLAGFGVKAVRGSLVTGMQRDYIRDILRGGGMVDLERPGATKHALRVQLFGALQVSLPEGKEVPLAWRSLKVASLFAYLLLHRSRVCDREELIGALWPKAKLKQGEQSLYAWIFQLKKALASGFLRAGARALVRRPFIVHREKGYRIDPALFFRVDVEEFLSQWENAKSLAEEGKREESEKAYRYCEKLYQGPFLSALGERWCEERRGEYEKIYLSCLRRLAAGRMEKKDYEEAVLLYNRYLHSEPLSEEVRIELWRALKALGRRADIQKDYKELQQLLKKDFGEDPQAGTREAFRDLFGNRMVEV